MQRLEISKLWQRNQRMHINVYTYLILYRQYTSYMFRPLLWPYAGRCITKEVYIKIF